VFEFEESLRDPLRPPCRDSSSEDLTHLRPLSGALDSGESKQLGSEGGAELRLIHHPRSVPQELRVAVLVTIWARGMWNENGRDPRCAELSHGRRPGPREGQIRRAQEARDILDELNGEIALKRFCALPRPSGAALMQDRQAPPDQDVRVLSEEAVQA
jgi:hypothetical protein